MIPPAQPPGEGRHAGESPARRRAELVITILGLIFLASPAPARDLPASPPDLEAYRQALKPGGTPAPVSFRDLWDHPDRHQGRPVRVAGRLERHFRQPARGDLPPLTEAWLLDPAGNPFCLIYPSDPSAPGPGSKARFDGTFLRMLRYRGADAERIAPLIVGPRPPRAGPIAPTSGHPAQPEAIDWAVGLALASLVILVLGVQHLRRPARRPATHGPPPRFVDPNEPPGGVEGTAKGAGAHEP